MSGYPVRSALFSIFFAAFIGACGSSSDAPTDGGAHDASFIDASADAAVDATIDASDGGRTSRIDEVLALLSSSGGEAPLDAIVHDIAFHEGWPLHEGGRYLFVTQWSDEPSIVSLVSDINAWATSAHTAERSLRGSFYYVVIEESAFVAPAAGAKYKWWGSPDVYRAPPEALAYGYDENGEFAWVVPPSTAPHLERFVDMASSHLSARTVRTWVPAGFVAGSTASSHLRSLVLHDGQNVFDPNAAYGGWQADAALASGYEDVVAIAIDNAPDRFDVYTHVTDSVSSSEVGGNADAYLDFIELDVLPFFRTRYGIQASGDSLMIAGSSLGGLVSIYAAMQRPTLFGCAAGLSSTLGWGSLSGDVSSRTVIEQWSSHLPSSIYLDSGGGEGGGCVDSDSDGVNDDGSDDDNYCVTLQMRDRLLELGYVSSTDVFYNFDAGAGHNEAAWRFRFPAALAACTSGGWAAP
ncbi:MAG: hypothetical protein IPK60_10075 [Sandaracinaceae bacterium]|nr:hypothetical protein [Sandaracinaceae bacterium]